MTLTTERAPQPAGDGRGGKRPGLFDRIALYNRQVVAELRKVVWPTQEQLITYFLVVMTFVLVMIAIVASLDLAFGKLVFWVFSGGATQ